MNTDQFKYDVAFSFLSQDEPLATKLNDRLQDRVKTFLYSKKQEQIAGTDGEKTFNAVFGKEARVVVLLYRNGWGQTPFTRIEETAIKNRGFEQGYDFLFCVPLDEPPVAPTWYPKPNLWLNLNRWGIDGAASVIEERIKEQGGQPHEETVQERAARLKRSLEFDEKRKRFLASEEGVKTANDEVELLRTKLQHSIAQTGFAFQFESQECQIAVVGLGIGLGLEWQCHFANSLRGAKLVVGLWKGHPQLQASRRESRQSRQIRETEFTFDLSLPDQCRWVAVGAQTRAFTTSELAAQLLKELMDECESHSREGS